MGVGRQIFLIELVTGTSAFAAYGSDPMNMCKAIIKGKISLPKDMNPVCKDLVKRCLRKDPELRIGGRNSIPMHLHPFVKEDSERRPIRWQDVLDFNLTPPWKPRLSNPMDSRRFKQPAKSEILEFGVQAPLETLRQKYEDSFGPIHEGSACPIFSTMIEKV